jgi:hypothetical protein
MDPQEIHLLLDQYLLLGVDMVEHMQIQVDLVVLVVVAAAAADPMPVERQLTILDQHNKDFLEVLAAVALVLVSEQVVVVLEDRANLFLHHQMEVTVG